jgi:hypothetical protein
MSNRYAASGKGQTTAAATNIISLRSTASVYAQLVQFTWVAEAATALPNGSLFLTTVVDTSGTAVAGQKRYVGAPSPSCTVVTGPTGGTLASVAIDRAGTPNSSGAGWIWNFESSPIWVPLSLSIVFRNDHASSAGPAISWTIVWDE